MQAIEKLPVEIAQIREQFEQKDKVCHDLSLSNSTLSAENTKLKQVCMMGCKDQRIRPKPRFLQELEQLNKTIVDLRQSLTTAAPNKHKLNSESNSESHNLSTSEENINRLQDQIKMLTLSEQTSKEKREELEIQLVQCQNEKVVLMTKHRQEMSDMRENQVEAAAKAQEQATKQLKLQEQVQNMTQKLQAEKEMAEQQIRGNAESHQVHCYASVGEV